MGQENWNGSHCDRSLSVHSVQNHWLISNVSECLPTDPFLWDDDDDDFVYHPIPTGQVQTVYSKKVLTENIDRHNIVWRFLISHQKVKRLLGRSGGKLVWRGRLWRKFSSKLLQLWSEGDCWLQETSEKRTVTSSRPSPGVQVPDQEEGFRRKPKPRSDSWEILFHPVSLWKTLTREKASGGVFVS